MKTGNRVFRLVTFILFGIALAAFFIPPVYIGGRVGVIWLVFGVVHAAAFCAVFFRDSRRRTALSIILTIFSIIWSLIVLALPLLILTSLMHITILSPVVVYGVCSLLAIIFALAGPRRLA